MSGASPPLPLPHRAPPPTSPRARDTLTRQPPAQFHYSEKTCCFDVITPSRVFRMQTPDGLQQLREWADCYKRAMGARDFPYFHVEQVTAVFRDVLAVGRRPPPKTALANAPPPSPPPPPFCRP